MSPEESRDEITLYLLDELTEGERAAFEAELMRSPRMQLEVRKCAETIGGLVSRSAGAQPVPMHLWRGVEAAIRREGLIGHEVQAGPSVSATACETVPWRSWFWPAAAALLLIANVGQWLIYRPQSSYQQRDFRELVAKSASDGGTSVIGVTSGNQAADTRNAADGGRLDPRDDDSRTDKSGEAEASERSGRGIGEKYLRLRDDYENLVEAVAPFVRAGVLRLDANGIWTSELRSYADTETGSAAGLWDRVRKLAPAAGVAQLPERWRLPGGYLFDSAIPGGATGVGIDDGIPPPSEYGEPFAVAVVNAAEGIGYLDLYNLPLVLAGQELHVWLQNETNGAFTSVGPVPSQLSGGSAALVFRVPGEAGSARRVVITLEPTGGASQPSGPIVIRGP